jgi:hypothetical protein
VNEDPGSGELSSELHGSIERFVKAIAAKR